jgi:hypothetical protein
VPAVVAVVEVPAEEEVTAAAEVAAVADAGVTAAAVAVADAGVIGVPIAVTAAIAGNRVSGKPSQACCNHGETPVRKRLISRVPLSTPPKSSKR